MAKSLGGHALRRQHRHLATLRVVRHYVAALGHEIGKHPMKDGAVVVAVPGQHDEVVHCHGRRIRKEIEHDLTIRGRDDCLVGTSRIDGHRRCRVDVRLSSLVVDGAMRHIRFMNRDSINILGSSYLIIFSS